MSSDPGADGTHDASQHTPKKEIPIDSHHSRYESIKLLGESADRLLRVNKATDVQGPSNDRRQRNPFDNGELQGHPLERPRSGAACMGATTRRVRRMVSAVDETIEPSAAHAVARIVMFSLTGPPS